MKCKKCGADKPLSEFSTNGAGLYKKRCKPCRTADEAARYRRKTPEEKQAIFRYMADWVRRNPEKYREYARKMKAANPEHYRAKVNMRRRRLRDSTPPWADKKAMERVYRAAVEMTLRTGVKHEVDHIVPITSATVCGLHWEGNLQILPEIENKRKNNTTWPDMP